MAVGQLASELPVSRPAVSQHLRVLKDAGLVSDRAEGTRRIYQLNQDGLQAIHAYLDRAWSEALAGFQRAAERIAAGRPENPERIGAVMTQATLTPVRHAVTVPLPADEAFALFTERFNVWWPQHHIGAAELAEVVLEPHAGGRWFERGVDGSECDWGTVLVCERPERLVMTWQISPEWKYDPDPAHASEVEVRFTETGGQTRVELEHRHIERHGEGAEDLHGQVSADEGWPYLMGLYAKAAG
jgi:uncharacterized protein YndB with AHSA1/START domain